MQMDVAQLRERLRAACDAAGSNVAWAKAKGLSAAYVSEVLKGRNDPGPKILDALGFERIVTFAPVREEEAAE